MKQLFTLVFFLVFTGICLAQDSVKCNDQVLNAPLLEKLTGNWEVNGEIGSDKINYNFTADWELNHQFLLLDFADIATPPAYAAHVYIGYDCISERYVALWLDNFGARYSETLGYGIQKGDSIDFRFEYPDGPFLNCFIYNRQSDTWHFHTTTKNSEGKWVLFGDMYLNRRTK